jgi:hypothetical protein
MIVIMNLLSDPQLVNRHPKDRVPRLVNHYPKYRMVCLNEKFHLHLQQYIDVCQKYDALKRRELQRFGNNVHIYKSSYLMYQMYQMYRKNCITKFIFFRQRIDDI